MMRIGELSRKSGLSPSRIRFYEAEGLLGTVARSANGYRLYLAETVQILDIINFAQQAGFTLDEMRPLLPQPGSGQWQRAELIASLQAKQAQIEKLQRKLARARRQVLSVLASIEAKPEEVQCMNNVAPTLDRAR